MTSSGASLHRYARSPGAERQSVEPPCFVTSNPRALASWQQWPLPVLWRCLNGSRELTLVIRGRTFDDGILLNDT